MMKIEALLTLSECIINELAYQPLLLSLHGNQLKTFGRLNDELFYMPISVLNFLRGFA